MKSISVLRVLCLLGFLLLMAPFYQQCAFGKQAEAPAEEAPVSEQSSLIINDSIAIQQEKVEHDSLIAQSKRDSIYQAQKPIYQKAYELVDDENNQNAFELAYMSPKISDLFSLEYCQEVKKDFKKHKYDGIELPIRSYSFVFIILFSLVMFLLSFTKRIRLLYKFSITNLILLGITLSCILFFDSFFETYKQIKWGYYVFTLVQIGIFFLSKKLSKIPRTN